VPREPAEEAARERRSGERRGEEQGMKTTIERPLSAPNLRPPPEVDDVTRREFLIGAAGLLVLAPHGCGNAGESSDEASSGETRAVRHALGTAEVPVRPGRIVSLSPAEITDPLIALGRKPVGSVTNAPDDPASGASPGYPPALAGRVEGIESVGSYPPNVEKIAALRPDLILCFEYDKNIYDRLSEIAPTVAVDSRVNDFKERLRKIATAVGAEGEVEEVLADYRARIEGLRPEVEGTSVAVVYPYGGDILVHGPEYLSSKVLADLGLEVQAVGGEFNEYGTGFISEELVPEISADHVFVPTYGLEDTTVEEVLKRPLWRALPAAKKGQVHPVQGVAWTNLGPLGALEVVDEVEKTLTREEP
jgi:iron complex transport system substrate-binding protein